MTGLQNLKGHMLGSKALRLAIIGTAAVGSIAIVSSSVYASLNAETYNTSAQAVSTDTLKLTMASSAVGGITGGVTAPIANVAPGAGTQVMTSTPAATLLTTPTRVSVASLAAGTTSHLRLEISLPAGSEVTTNGALPATTIQGVTSNLTWTFTEAQRLATTTSN